MEPENHLFEKENLKSSKPSTILCSMFIVRGVIKASGAAGLLLGANQPGWQRATPAPLSKATINEKPSSSVEFHMYILYNSTSVAVAMNSLFHIIYIYVVFSNIHIMIFLLIL